MILLVRECPRKFQENLLVVDSVKSFS